MRHLVIYLICDTVDVNVIHVSMPSGGKGSKRSEINLEKHLQKKRSIVRIQNDDDLCMARALVVAKVKLDNNPQDRQIRDHRRPMQMRLAQELHQSAGVPLGSCGIEGAKQFQAYLTDYQISIVSKEYSNKIIYAGPEKDKKIYLYMHNNHYDVITKMPAFFARSYYCHTCKKHTIIRKSITVRMRATIVGFLPNVPLCPGKLVKIVIECSRANSVMISINNLEAMPDPFAKV